MLRLLVTVCINCLFGVISAIVYGRIGTPQNRPLLDDSPDVRIVETFNAFIRSTKPTTVDLLEPVRRFIL